MAEGSPQGERDAEDERTYIFKAEIQDGRCFGPDVQAVACAATFAGVTKLTPYSVGRGDHVWNVPLAWKVSQQQLRQLQAQGQKDCKVVCSNKDGVKLGWFVLDMRAAKLQHQYKKDEGKVVSLLNAHGRCSHLAPGCMCMKLCLSAVTVRQFYPATTSTVY